MLTKTLHSLLFIFGLSLIATAQVNLSGKVVDDQEPLAFCNILLLDSDSTFLTGDTADENGMFTLIIEPGDYLLQVSYVGYDNYSQSIQLTKDTDLGTIQIGNASIRLDEVVVSAQKQLIERKADRLVFNVGSSIAAQGADLSKAIALAPGIVVRNNAISMLGRGNVRVMIEGRILQLQGEELIAFLSTISADDIDKIEVITNPPADYEAAGNGGLVNVIFKKGRGNSWKNTTSMAFTKSREGFATLRNSFQLNKDKHRFSLSLNGTVGDNWNTEYGTTYFPKGAQSWESIYVSSNNNASTRLTYDYQWTDKTSLGFQYQGAFASPGVSSSTSSDVAFSEIMSDSTFVNETTDDRSRQSHVANMHLFTKLDTTGKSLSLDIDYFSYRQKTDALINVNVFDSEENFNGLSRARHALTDQHIQNYSIKADLQHPTDLVQFSYGAKYNYNISKNELENFNQLSDVSVFDSILSNTFEYDEHIVAAYLSGSHQFSKKWNLQLGLRLEHTANKGFSETLNKTNTNNYTRLFPTAYLSYNASDEHQWSWSVGGRVNRASFRDLNPFRIYLNNTSYSEGNPFLNPSYTYSYNMDYVFKGRYTTSAFYNRTTNGFGTLFVPSTESSVLATLRDNYYDTNFFGLGELFPVTINKRWSMQNQAYLFYSHSSLYDNYNAKAQNGFQYYLSSNSSITFSKGWKAQLNLSYNSPGKGNLYEVDARWTVDFGIQKKLFNNKLLLNLQVNDLFDTSSLERYASEINGVLNTYGQNSSNRNIRLSLSYIFGNDKINVKNRNFGNEETQRRL
jgi:iron complex outermembrane receptor protein